MSFSKPEPGRYRRIKDGAEVTVTGVTGNTWLSTVAVQGKRLSHVRLENFWKKYEPVVNTQEPCDTCSSTAGGCAECRTESPAVAL